jgi:BirA family transcriptional regulator, biotin operon repressor / biotin---[acetyl-CoA-carboxylase] ligase
MSARHAVVEIEPSAAPSVQRDALHEAVLHRLARGSERSVGALAHALDTDAHAVRAAIVWLQDEGFRALVIGDRVEATSFMPLDVARLREALDAAGGGGTRWDAQVVGITASTNSDLLQAVRSSNRLDRPVVRLAELQHAGRGRLGRAWHMVPGASLVASFAIPLARPLAMLHGASLVCGLAALAALEPRLRARLKWPNDIVIEGRKLAGILVEAHAMGDATVLVVGIGMNVSTVPPVDATEARAALPPIDLECAGSPPVDRHRLAAALALALDDHLRRFGRDGFGAFVDAWNDVDAFRGRRVAMYLPDGAPATGLACGVDVDGALLVDIDGVRRRFIAGDVSLRAA